MTMTVTEALAEIKTLGKRLEKKREFVNAFLCRQDAIRDPLLKDGGSATALAAERQSINDLETNLVNLRRGIQLANEREMVTLNGNTRSIADWLVWRREVAPGQKSFLGSMRQKIDGVREQARRNGMNLVQSGVTPAQPTDVIVNIDERSLANEIETLEQTLGTLDGVLSLKNATIMIQPVATAA